MTISLMSLSVQDMWLVMRNYGKYSHFQVTAVIQTFLTFLVFIKHTRSYVVLKLMSNCSYEFK